MLKIMVYIVIASTLLSSCRKRTKYATENKINLSLSTHIDSVDPARSYDAASAKIVYNTYEQLYQYHYLKRPYEIIPNLAEGMPQYNDDLTEVVIKIKKNIPYHDDETFNGKIRYVKSQDFETQIKRLLFPGTRSNGGWLLEDKIIGVENFKKKVGNSIEKMLDTKLEGVQTPNDYTLILKLKAPYPQLKYVLAMSFLSPIPSETVRMYNNNFENKIIGTGPFKLEHWVKNSKIVLKKFEGYRDSLYPQSGDHFSNRNGLLKDARQKIPFVDLVEFNIIKESQTRWLNFLSKKIDIMELPKDNFSSVIDSRGNLKPKLKEDNIVGQLVTSSTYYWFAFNMKDPLIGKNKYLRYAIFHAINRQRFIKIFTNNTGLLANSIYPPGVFGHKNIDKKDYYDLKLAKKFLAKAGFPDGKGLPEITFDTRNPSTTARQEAEFIKSELSKVGIKIRISTNNFPTFLKKARQGELQFWKGGWIMDYLDPENSLQLLYSKNLPPGPNSSSFNNKYFDQIFLEANSLPENNKKMRLLEKANKIVTEQKPWIMSHYERYYILNHKKILNFRYSDTVTNYLKYLKVDPSTLK